MYRYPRIGVRVNTLWSRLPKRGDVFRDRGREIKPDESEENNKGKARNKPKKCLIEKPLHTLHYTTHHTIRKGRYNAMR